MSRLHSFRIYAHRFGVDLSRWPDAEPSHYRALLLNDRKVDLVLDVGANDGGYSQELRHYGYRGDIVSFEPLSSPRRRLVDVLDPRWTVRGYALGDFDGHMTINVAGNNEASSSALDMLPAHNAAAESARFVSTEDVEVRRLDSIWRETVGQHASVFLKVDVQGFDRQVLDGASKSLSECVGLQMETSFEALYDGAPLWDETFKRVLGLGFVIYRIDPGFTDTRNGRMLQADVTFYRP